LPLAIRYDWGARSILVIHNLAGKAVTTSFKLDPPPGPGGLIDLFGEGEFSCDKEGNVTIKIAGYGFRWLRIRRTAESTAL
jgi:hypothetical protein